MFTWKKTLNDKMMLILHTKIEYTNDDSEEWGNVWHVM